MEDENDIAGDLDALLLEAPVQDSPDDVVDLRLSYLQIYREHLACMGEMKGDPFPAWTDQQMEAFLQDPDNRACVREFSHPHGRRDYLFEPDFLEAVSPLTEMSEENADRIARLLATELAFD